MANQPIDRTLQSPPGPEVTVGGERYLYFGGTSYLGLHAEPSVIETARAALQRYGLHSATSRSGFGETPVTRTAELAIARHFGTEDAFHVASGWPGVAILVATLRGSFDCVLVDEHCHYSGFDGGAVANLPLQRFPHRDPAGLRELLSQFEGRRPLLITDGVFAANGQTAPLDAYAELLTEHGGGDLLVDDAHGFGVLGEHGRGSVEHAGLGPLNADREPTGLRVFACGTLSKALGAFGGAIPGERAFLDRAREQSHWFDGASAPPVPVAAAATEALRIARAEPERRERLRELADRLRAGLRELGLEVEALPTPVVALQGPPAEELQAVEAALRQEGILVPHMRYRGLPPGGALRIAVFATHSTEQIDRLLASLARHFAS